MTSQIFAQATPAAATTTLLYNANVHGITNIWAASLGGHDAIRIAIVPNAQPLTSNCYIAYDTFLYNRYVMYMHNICFAPGDNVMVWSTTGNSSFTMTGYSTD